MSRQNLPSRTRATPRPFCDEAPEDRSPVDEPPVPTLPAYDHLPKSRQRARGTSYVTAPPEALAVDDPLLDFAPVPHVAPRRNSITPDRQRKFIAHLAATGIVTQAAKHIGASMEALYKLRQKPGAEGFRAAWEAAADRGIARLEDCALARAIEGEERMVASSGKLLGTERRHNEALVMFFLRHRRADRYGSDVRPGHPLYERIRAEVLAEHSATTAQEEDAALHSLLARIDTMREREEAARGMLEEDGEGGDGGER